MLKFMMLTAVTAAVIFAQGQGQGKPPEATGMKGLGGFGLSSVQLERLAAFLGFSDQQLKDAQAIVDQARADEEKLATQTQDVQQQIRDLVQKSTAEFDAGIQALISTYISAEAQEMAIRLKAMNRIWNLLTPDQQKKADELRQFLKPPAGNSGNPGNGGGPKGNNGKGKGNQ
jgi:Spy/CpxP family protein refolding chaperone